MDDQRTNRECSEDKVTYVGDDPARIDRMIELLREAWHLSPHSRLGQLVLNAADVTDGLGSLFYMGDQTLEAKIQSHVRVLKTLKNAKKNRSTD